MALQIKDGDYIPHGGLLRRLWGDEAMLQRVLFRLTARRGSFPFLPDLGSRLYQLGRVPKAGRLSAARQYVAEALAEEKDLTVEDVKLSEEGLLQVVLTCGERRVTFEMTVEE